MFARHLNRLARLGFVVAGGLAAAASGACSKGPSGPPLESPVLTSAPAEVFHFAPPDGTRFERTDRRKQELAIIGAPARRVDEEELRWKVAIERKGDGYVVKQDLVHLALRRDGKVLAEGKVEAGISAELVIDRDGSLREVRGLDTTAERLRKLAAPGMEAAAEQLITPKYLADIVALRYRVLFGETIGRQATPGASWTITNPPGSFVASRQVTVDRQERCGNTTCALMSVDFKIDPGVMADSAVALVRSRVVEGGGDPTKVRVRAASYGMSGAMLTEPATMLSHGASFAEIGRVTVTGPAGEEMQVELKGTTELAYRYLQAPMAVQPQPRRRAILAEK